VAEENKEHFTRARVLDMLKILILEWRTNLNHSPENLIEATVICAYPILIKIIA
jgi:hypothetical protein